jgi:hypothetical protein
MSWAKNTVKIENTICLRAAADRICLRRFGWDFLGGGFFWRRFGRMLLAYTYWKKIRSETSLETWVRKVS